MHTGSGTSTRRDRDIHGSSRHRYNRPTATVPRLVVASRGKEKIRTVNTATGFHVIESRKLSCFSFSNFDTYENNTIHVLRYCNVLYSASMDSVSLVLVSIFLAISLEDSIFQFDRVPKFDDRDFRRPNFLKNFVLASSICPSACARFHYFSSTGIAPLLLARHG